MRVGMVRQTYTDSTKHWLDPNNINLPKTKEINKNNDTVTKNLQLTELMKEVSLGLQTSGQDSTQILAFYCK
jgi:hypothetical protein